MREQLRRCSDIYLDGATQEGSRNVMSNMSTTFFHNIGAYAPVDHANCEDPRQPQLPGCKYDFTFVLSHHETASSSKVMHLNKMHSSCIVHLMQ